MTSKQNNCECATGPDQSIELLSCRKKNCDDCKTVLSPQSGLGRGRAKDKESGCVSCKKTSKCKPALVAKPPKCTNRLGLGGASYILRAWMAKGQQAQDDPEDLCTYPKTWAENEGTFLKKQQKAVGFHKGFKHDECGEIIDLDNYKDFVCKLVSGDRIGLDTTIEYASATTQMVDPWSGMGTTYVGAATGAVHLPTPPRAFSNENAADMVYNYLMACVTDLPFKCYDQSCELATVVSMLNKAEVREFTKDHGPHFAPGQSGQFTKQNVFRGNSTGNTLGPYLSQFFCNRIITNATNTQEWGAKQELFEPRIKYDDDCKVLSTLSGSQSHATYWTFSAGQAVSNMDSKSNEAWAGSVARAAAGSKDKRYVCNGRDLGSMVRGEPTSQYGYQTALLLQNLGVRFNPGLPAFTHASGNSTAQSHAVAQAYATSFGNLSRMHAYYWKWFQYRQLRPEAAGLYSHLEKIGIKCYDWPSWYMGWDQLWCKVKSLNSDLFDAYPNANKPNVNWGPGVDPCDPVSYTYPGINRGGAPRHPSYPAAHSYIAGTAFTVLKFVYDDTQLLKDVPGYKATGSNTLGSAFVAADLEFVDNVQLGDGVFVVPNSDGSKLCVYKNESSEWTVGHEIDKIMNNISIGRAWLGVHYNSDNTIALLAGEKEALRMCQDLLSTWYQDEIVELGPDCFKLQAPEVKFTSLNGQICSIRPSVCYI